VSLAQCVAALLICQGACDHNDGGNKLAIPPSLSATTHSQPLYFVTLCYKGAGDNADDDDEEGTGRAKSQFKSHLKKSEAASEFSRTKTIAQQRRSLPVYTVREELLQVCGGGVCFTCGEW
jgi:hypothetical protein